MKIEASLLRPHLKPSSLLYVFASKPTGYNCFDNTPTIQLSVDPTNQLCL